MTMTSLGWPYESYVCSAVHPLPLVGTVDDPASRRDDRVDVLAGVVVTVALDPAAAFLRGGMV
jgi:hypothetical protein